MILESEELFSPESLGRVRRRAEQAAAAGKNTFPIPEAAGVAEFLAAMVPVGPLRTEAERWLGVGASYHALARLAARAATSVGGDEVPGSAVYVPKAAGELEPIPRTAKADDVLLVLNSDTLIHRRPPFSVEIACGD